MFGEATLHMREAMMGADIVNAVKGINKPHGYRKARSKFRCRSTRRRSANAAGESYIAVGDAHGQNNAHSEYGLI